jgi:hypothetical protein
MSLLIDQCVPGPTGRSAIQSFSATKKIVLVIFRVEYTERRLDGAAARGLCAPPSVTPVAGSGVVVRSSSTPANQRPP